MFYIFPLIFIYCIVNVLILCDGGVVVSILCHIGSVVWLYKNHEHKFATTFFPFFTLTIFFVLVFMWLSVLQTWDYGEGARERSENYILCKGEIYSTSLALLCVGRSCVHKDKKSMHSVVNKCINFEVKLGKAMWGFPSISPPPNRSQWFGNEENWMRNAYKLEPHFAAQNLFLFHFSGERNKQKNKQKAVLQI